jgi:hypothetical protein
MISEEFTEQGPFADRAAAVKLKDPIDMSHS